MPLLLNAATNPGTAQWTEASALKLGGFVEVSHQVLTSAGQFAAVAITAQQYRWLEILVYGLVSSTNSNVYLECNGSTAGYFQIIRGYANNQLSAAGYSSGSIFGRLSGTGSSPPNPGVCRVLLPLVPSGPTPFEATGGHANGVFTEPGTWASVTTGQNTDAGPITAVRALVSGTTFASGSTMTIFGMGVS